MTELEHEPSQSLHQTLKAPAASPKAPRSARLDSAPAVDLDPQNPYVSFLVAASAGSGKTHQLSQRFLYLTSAGAAPGSVLTVTFTKKAAGEMRARILAEAARLMAEPARQAAFDARMRQFYLAAGPGRRPPIPAKVLAPRLLASSQLLKISTIDSLFLEWTSKFPFEARGDHAGEAGSFPTTLLDPLSTRQLETQAWRATGQILVRALRRGEPWPEALLASLPTGGVLALQKHLAALDRQDTYVWYAERLCSEGESVLAAPPMEAGLSERELMERVAAPFRTIAASLSDKSRQARCFDALDRRDYAALLATELLTKEFTVSGRYIRGAKREALAREIAVVETAVRAHTDAQRLQALHATGGSHYQLFRLFRSLRDQLKAQAGAMEFRDLVKGAHQLLHGEGGAGVRFLLARSVQHVLLDEFQDTSRLQWAVFHALIAPMLAGDGLEDSSGLEPTVFIVGDEKQSIYGFREADPAVMAEARVSLGERLRTAPLSESYRTAQVVLDYVNSVFKRRDQHFPLHRTAQLEGHPFVPDCGRVLLLPLVQSEEDDAEDPEGDDLAEAGSTDAASREAEALAAVHAALLADPEAAPVYDKASQSYRPLRASDCCILYRSTTHAATLELALRRRGLACQREEEKGFFSRSEVQDSLALLRFLAFPGDSVALASFLRSPLGGVPDAVLLRLFAETKGTTDPALAVLTALPEVVPGLAATLTMLRREAEKRLPHALLLLALTQLGAFSAYSHPELYQDEDAALARRNLARLVEIVIHLEDHGHVNLVPLSERLAAMAASDELGNAVGPRSGITLMTIHKAKGLEFPSVAVMDCGRPWGKRDLYWAQTGGMGERPGLRYIGKRSEQPLADAEFQDLLEATEAQVASECQRLLYVALTRPRQYLLISGHRGGRSQGLAETVVYEQLAEALASPPAWRALRTLSLGGVEVQEWCSLGNAAGVRTVVKSTSEERSPAAPSPATEVSWLPTPRVGLPRELVITAPSKHEAGKSSLGASGVTLSAAMSPPFAAAVGTFLHKGLEAFMQGRDFAHAALWHRLVPPGAEAERWRETVLAELNELRQDAQLLSLRSSARRIETEMPLAHQRASELMLGSLDLLLEDHEGSLLLVDYKSNRFAAPLDGSYSDEALRAFCRERGYDAQVADYAAAVAELLPQQPLSGFVYFTTLRRFIQVV